MLVIIAFAIFLTRTSYKDIKTNVTNYSINYRNPNSENNMIEVKVSFDLDNFNNSNHLSAQCINSPISSDETTDFSESKKVSLVDDTYEVIFNVPMEYEYRITLFETAQDGPEHTERMRLSIEERIANPDIYLSGNRLMFVALDDNKVIGIIETYGNNRISLMFVDSNYQRQGIATELMSRMVCQLKMSGFDKIVLILPQMVCCFTNILALQLLKQKKTSILLGKHQCHTP